MSDTTENNHNESVEGLSIIQRLIGILISPGKTFSQIKEKPDWIIPLLVAITISISVQIVIKPYFFNSKQYETTITDLMEKTDMDRESAEEMMQKKYDNSYASICVNRDSTDPAALIRSYVPRRKFGNGR